MFEDCLVESTHHIRTRSSRYAAGSLLLETALLALIVLLPYLYPAALPRKYLAVPLLAPPPSAPLPLPRHEPGAATHSALLRIDLNAPAHIPSQIAHIVDAPTCPGLVDLAAVSQPAAPVVYALTDLGTPPSLPRVHPAKPAGPLRISAGVAAGQLLTPIRPEYPTIARAAGIQGIVVISATISAAGRIDNLRVLSGPSLLVNAAVAAVRQARYRPYELNGQPVAIETTVNIVFSLGN